MTLENILQRDEVGGRMNNKNSVALLIVLFIVTLFRPVAIQAEQPMSRQALVEALRQGGYNLYFRHEATDWSQQDAIRQNSDWLGCDGGKTRQLSEQGRQRAAKTGVAMRKLKIPVGEVLASPYCRTMDTARQLGLGEVSPTTDVINMRVADYFGGRTAVVETTRDLLSRAPTAGGNRVIVAHGNVARAATPVYPGEGEMVVFKPDGNGRFSYVGRIAPDQWAALLPEG